MPDVAIRIEGVERLRQKFGRLEGVRYIRAMMQAAASDVKNWVARYPVSSVANSPSNPTGRWYQRGFGPRWRRKGGRVGGRRTSQTLGKRWTTRVGLLGMQAVVGNNASYARYVQDEEYQARFHKARGWRTVQGAVREFGPRIVEKVRLAIDAIVRG